MEILFWTGFCFVAYTYFGYPLSLYLFARLSNRNLPELAGPEEWPVIAIVIPVHNEVEKLAAKISNLNELDYPKEKLKVYFSSDGSEDGTNDYLDSAEGVSNFCYHPRRGKPSAINHAVKHLEEGIILFTDARQQIARDAIKKLVTRLLQPGVGAVSGELVHYDSKSQTGDTVGLYWRYEKWIRKQESAIHSVAGVTGALYCIRREDFTPIPEDTLLDDIQIPINILKKGKRIVIEAGALVFDEVQENLYMEKVRKVRTLAGNYQCFIRNSWLFSPRLNPIWFQFLSHKFFRLLVPYALVLMLVGSWFAGGVYSILALAQIIFYLVAIFGQNVESLKQNKLVSIASVFYEINLAAVLGLVQFLRSRTDVKWDKTT